MMTLQDISTRLAAGALALSVLVLAGCDKRGGAGGPGATATDAKPPMYGQSDNTTTPST